MKLTDRYIADDYALQENLFWSKHIQEFFFNILEVTPNIEERQIIYSSKFEYKLKEKELNYYKNSYIHIGQIIEKDENVAIYDYFDESIKEICTREKDIIDYLTKIESKLLVIRGKVGWGKTTLLQYFFFYLLQHSAELKEVIYPIFISLHREIKEEPDKNENLTIKSLFYIKLLEPRLKKICEGIIDIENEAFWNYIIDFPDCVDYKREHTNYLKIFKDNPLLAHKNILQLRASYQKNIADILFYAIKYLTEEKGKKPIVIIDDADRIDIQWNKDILEELHKLSNKYNFKVIFAVRPSTYYGVFKNDSHLMEIINPAIMELNKPLLGTYLLSRKNMISDYKEKNKREKIIYDKIEIDKSKCIDFFIKMTELIEKPTNFNFISNISSGDIRNLGRILRKYYSTNFINHTNLFLRYIDGKITSLPDWLLYIPIITNNYITYFSGNKDTSRSEEFIINIFSSRNHAVSTNLIRIHLLSYLIKNKSINLKFFRDEYISLFKNKHKDNIINNFNYSIKTLINFRLISSEEFFSIDNEENIERIEEITIEPPGRYYFENLLFNFEYLSYMKDDVDYDTKVEIEDCISVHGFLKRYKSVVLFIDYLFKKEAEMLHEMTDQGFNKYMNDFSVNQNMLFFSQLIAENILLYAKEKLKTLHGGSNDTTDLLSRNNLLESKINSIKDASEIITKQFFRKN